MKAAKKAGAAPPTYNRPTMRAAYLLSLLALSSAPVLAQNTSQNTAQPAPELREQLSNKEQASRHGQRIERITVEDAGSRIDELRVGGQTQSITVQPKTGAAMPAYEVLPGDGARARPGGPNGGGTMTQPRVWNLGRF